MSTAKYKRQKKKHDKKSVALFKKLPFPSDFIDSYGGTYRCWYIICTNPCRRCD